MKLPATIFGDVVKLPSSVVALLVLDLIRMNLISGRIDTSFWSSFANKEGLYSEMWLVAYEATKKGWWPKEIEKKFIENDEFFGELLDNGVYFYDETQKSRKNIPRSFSTLKIDLTLDYD